MTEKSWDRLCQALLAELAILYCIFFKNIIPAYVLNAKSAHNIF